MVLGDAPQVPLAALAFLLLLEQSVAAVKQHLETCPDSSGRKLFAWWEDRAQQDEPRDQRMRQQLLVCSSGSALLHAHCTPARICPCYLQTLSCPFLLVALAKRGTLFLLSPALPSLQPTPRTARLPGASRCSYVESAQPGLGADEPWVI